MSKKQFKSQASSSRAVSGATAAASGAFGSGAFGVTPIFGAVSSSPLSYVYEPPDLNAVSEPNVVVAFKNLQKKDSTTKAKALEELQSFVQSLNEKKEGVDDGILEAWIKIYPRTSIDSARRVRQLAHIVQGHVSLSCGKRVARHLPTIVGPWLAGLYDVDRSVARATQESLEQVFPSVEKRSNLWRLYRSFIIAFCNDAVTKESVYTLSDERTISPDDALAKHARVVGASILVVINMIENYPPEKAGDHDDAVGGFLAEEKIWDLASHSDAFVRRAVYKLLVATLIKKQDTLDLKLISAKLLTSSLHIDQTGSALAYARALAVLTQHSPGVWTEYYSGSGKKSAARRLQQFLKKGSQGGSVEFWGQVESIICNLPLQVFVSEANDGVLQHAAPGAAQSQPAILQVMLQALRKRDEPSRNLVAAWNAYLKVFERVQALLTNKSNRHDLLKDFLLPIFVHYIKPSQESSQWTMAKDHQFQLDICAKAFILAWHEGEEIVHDYWTNLSEGIIEDIKTSLPEQSKNYSKSQSSISEETSRWFELEEHILKEDYPHSVKALFEDTSSSVLQAAIESITTRNGKPSGAAATLVSALQSTPQLIYNNAKLSSLVSQFVQRDIPKLALSPSAPHLFKVLGLLEGISGVDVGQPYQACLRLLDEAPESPAKSKALTSLLSSPFLTDFGKTEVLQDLMNGILELTFSGEESYWDLVQAILRNPATPAELVNNLIATSADSLHVESKTLISLEMLSMTAKRKRDALRSFATSTGGTKLLSRLLSLSENPEESVAEKAKALSVTIQGIVLDNEGLSKGVNPIIKIIRQDLATPTLSSLPIESLVEQALKLFNEAAEDEKATLVSHFLPTAAQWAEALSPLMELRPNLALAITNPLATAIAFVENVPASTDSIEYSIPRDSDGLSSALRLAWFATRLTKVIDILLYYTEDEKITTCGGIALVLQLAADNLSLPNSNSLWDTSRPEFIDEIVNIVGDAQGLLASWLQEKQSFLTSVQEHLLKSCRRSTTDSYYNARAYSAITTEISEVHGRVSLPEHQELVEQVRKSREPDFFYRAMAILTSAPESGQLSRLANELVADLTGHDFNQGHEKGLRSLLYLNSINYRHEDVMAEIPKPRLVFFVKSLVTALGNLSSLTLRGEIIRALNVVLPCIKETYDDFWADLLVRLPTIWLSLSLELDDAIPLLHASLRLLSMLRGLVSKESNDDLVDSWKENEGLISDALLLLLKLLQGVPDEWHQPRKTTNELLSRQIIKFPPSSILVPAEFYPAVASESLALQQSAYDLLHRHIPKQQEQVSLDKALTKDYVTLLPEELISLILAPPDEEALAEMGFERRIPAPLRSYLLSWKLVYDHWTNASYAVQADYANSLKEGTYLNNLLDFASKLLITARSRPVDASKFEIMKFSPEEGESPETDTHFFLIHLYTLSLTCLPNLSKSWWRDSTSRQTMLAVESWTEKYISPLIIANELATVSAWAPSQAAVDQPLAVKVSHTTHEITASIPVDEQTMSIAIRLPPSYPLARATVDSIHRVGVDEKKWRSWLITTQGVINFSSEGKGGSLIEGLMAWRRNVTATLKGQTECSICYSVVSAERQLPSKRCGTCRNMFHGGCLYRWFKSSNSSSCPLCRNAFNYS